MAAIVMAGAASQWVDDDDEMTDDKNRKKKHRDAFYINVNDQNWTELKVELKRIGSKIWLIDRVWGRRCWLIY